MRPMNQNKKTLNLKGISPWIIIGALAVLLPIFAFMTYQIINLQKKNTIRLLLEKGAALIRSFEAGTRTGMMTRRWNGRQLQRLLSETAQQNDIDYILVADRNGIILAHNDPAHIGKIHHIDLESDDKINISETKWRIVTNNEGKQEFEVFRSFLPDTYFMTHQRNTYQRMINQWLVSHTYFTKNITPSSLEIYIGLDMRAVEEAIHADTRYIILMAIVLLLIGFTGIIFLFLSQRYRATKTSLSRIKAFSDNLVEHMPIGILVIDTKGRIISCNNVAERLLHIPSYHLIDQPAMEHLPPELFEQLEFIQSNKTIIEKELLCDIGFSQRVPVELIASCLYDEQYNFHGYVLLLKDLTEVQALRKEIDRSQRMASIGRLAAGVAHEIRNPLSSIKGFATYFKERYKNNNNDIEILTIMIQEIDRLNRVVSQLLELARPISISGTTTNIKSLISDSIKVIEQMALEKHIHIQAQFEPNIKDVFIDKDRLSQTLLNLYLNALEAMDDQGKLLISLLPYKENGIEIQISDSGTGIDKEALGHIFDPYYTTKPNGTGLGLAIVHNIIEAHNGLIMVNSTKGKGTTFTIKLPSKS
ncbi:sensor protein ZraS [Candidatus Magnetomorum sp. HK-1]|nr:sensor protein ZraS [Candidatus Magnetomorum sp. HK-1]